MKKAIILLVLLLLVGCKTESRIEGRVQVEIVESERKTICTISRPMGLTSKGETIWAVDCINYYR